MIAQSQLPSDMPAPTVGTFDPAQATVLTIGLSSSAVSPGQMSAIVNNDIVPAIEQIDGVSNVNANGAVTPAFEVQVNPICSPRQATRSATLSVRFKTTTTVSPAGIAICRDMKRRSTCAATYQCRSTVENLPIFASCRSYTTSSETLSYNEPCAAGVPGAPSRGSSVHVSDGRKLRVGQLASPAAPAGGARSRATGDRSPQGDVDRRRQPRSRRPNAVGVRFRIAVAGARSDADLAASVVARSSATAAPSYRAGAERDKRFLKRSGGYGGRRSRI